MTGLPVCTDATELMLSIGSVVLHVHLTGASPAFGSRLHARYGAFEMPPSALARRDMTLRLVMRPPPAPPTPSQLMTSPAPAMNVVFDGKVLTAERWDFGVRALAEGLTPDPTVGNRGASLHAEGWCGETVFAFDALLRVLYATALPLLGGLLVHSCGLSREAIGGDAREGGLVFPGRSGAGKSTLARRAAAEDGVHILSDEIVAVRRDRRGWRVHGTPFWGDFGSGGRSLRTWPLLGLGFLQQAPEGAPSRIEPLATGPAVLRLLGCVLAFTTDALTVTRNLALATDLCHEVPVADAVLTKTEPARRLFDEFARVPRRVPPSTTLTPREVISDLRHFLRDGNAYAFRPTGSSMWPWVRSGDTAFIRAAQTGKPAAGDVFLFWRPGASPDDDVLICHRLLAIVPGDHGPPTMLVKGDAQPRIQRLTEGRDGEILGLLVATSRHGRTTPEPARVIQLARAATSVLAMFLLRVVRG